jgi:hypothetical protein
MVRLSARCQPVRCLASPCRPTGTFPVKDANAVEPVLPATYIFRAPIGGLPDSTMASDRTAPCSAFGQFEDAAWLDAGRQEYETNMLETAGLPGIRAGCGRHAGGIILNTSSLARLAGTPLVLPYSSIKGQLHSLWRAARAAPSDLWQRRT